MEFYNLSVNGANGETIPMSDFKGKVVLIVNTATRCGLTPQFNGLQNLHHKFNNLDLVVLGFPCNQFANQEPESNNSIESYCKVNFGVTFPLTEKINVNGPDTHPIYKFLKNPFCPLL